MTPSKADVLQGTLDLMVLKTLDTMGSLHGYGIAQRLQQLSENVLQLNQGTLYPALLRLEQRGWISSKWGTSDNKRRAPSYSPARGRARSAALANPGREVGGALLGGPLRRAAAAPSRAIRTAP